MTAPPTPIMAPPLVLPGLVKRFVCTYYNTLWVCNEHAQRIYLELILEKRRNEAINISAGRSYFPWDCFVTEDFTVQRFTQCRPTTTTTSSDVERAASSEHRR